MPEPVDLIVISALGCACAYLYAKQTRLERKSAESIPLLKNRETKLEEGERLLRDETLKQANEREALAKIAQELEGEKKVLEASKAKLEDEISKQKSISDELTARSKAVEEGEAKLKGDIESFEAKVAAEEKEIQSKTECLESKEKEVESKAASVAKDLSAVEEKLAKLAEDSISLEEKRAEQQTLQESLQKKTEELESREAAVEKAEADLKAKEEEVKADEAEIEADEAEEKETEVTSEEPAEEPKAPETSDAEKRKSMIEAELDKLIKKANEEELDPEDPFDDDSIEALKKAAMKICYVKQYYDVMKDELIMFPSVAKTCLDYRLTDEAEKHYFEEEDEFPVDLTGAIREVAFKVHAEEEDEDFDEEYHSTFAQDVEF